MKVQPFASYLVGDKRNSFWARDKDRCASEELLSEVARRTVTPVDKVRASTVADLAEKIAGHHQPNGNSPWVLPIGVWHRKRKQFGTQYCPLCLKLDQKPYVRRSWRMAFYTECEQHHVLLENHCPQCLAPFCVHRSEMGHYYIKDGLPVSRCFNCCFDLTSVIPRRMEWPTWQHSIAVRSLLLQRGLPEVWAGDRHFPNTPEFFAVVRRLIAMMSSTRSVGDLYDYVARNIWPEGFPVLSNRGQKYEVRDVEGRHILFGMAVWLMLEWPTRLEAAIDRLSLTRTDLSRDSKGELPYWFVQMGITWSAKTSPASLRRPTNPGTLAWPY